ncbi:DEAD/DEAH box helicase family protein [Arenimonas sp.]|uniref:DEAD/DEAH box helicase family protein n=1 Tax=Arenimonas sp. TaxID=1872635 RepID=UPI0025C1842F|nr:DEAD/DEAH box helicase family protein [Arenimonas sp.]
MSNFSFLQAEWALVHEAAVRCEQAAHADPRASCFYARRGLEIAVAWLYAHDKAFQPPYQDTLSALIYEPTFRKQVGEALFAKARLIKDLGNLAVHSHKRVAESDALTASRELFHFCFWMARRYGRQVRPAPSLSFSPDLLPKISGTPALSQAEIEKLSAALAERDEALEGLKTSHEKLNAELEELREEVAAAKKANAAEPDTHDYSEAETRKAYIDLLLREAGWSLDPAKNFEIEVAGMPNNEAKGFVDYVLWGDDGKPLMLVEAKRTTRSPKVGQQQAKLYADCLEKAYGQRPVIFYSNGYEHWMWDDVDAPPRRVQGFYKKDELELLIQRRTSRKRVADVPINASIIERYYQIRAVRRVGETFEVDHQRKSLLVMATGSGKTRTVIALIDVLMRANWAKRVLFLADRVALVNQAVNAFKTHLPDAAPVNLVTEKNTDGRVFVSTYPTMMGLIDEAPDGQRRFGVGHFDLIVIDEAHRSIYQKYRAIFEYFDSMLVGLTATPKDEIDKNTYGLFDLETGVPTDAYTLEQAIADGHLVKPIPIAVPTKFQREGIRYADLSDEEKEQWESLDWSDDGTIPDEIDPAELNQWLFNVDTVDKVLEVLMTKGHRVAGGDRLGKTIVFAKNNDHADFIAERFNANYPEYKGHFARVITYKTEYAQSLIDDFSKKEKAPHLAISVDMLDTGIDVPEVVNLVFFKVVRSKTKFWQMVGRGTRLCQDLYGPGQHKKDFVILDFCGNLEFFSQNPNFSDVATTEALSTRLFKARVQMLLELDALRGKGTPVEQAQSPVYGDSLTDAQLRADIAQGLHAYVAAMNPDNFVVRPQRRYVETFSTPEAWSHLGPDSVEALFGRVAGLPSAAVDQDEEAKRFDLLILRAQLSILQAGKDFGPLMERIRRIAAELEGQMAIPAVKAEAALIQEVASEEWWEYVTVPMLELVRRRLRALIKLIPKGRKVVVYSNFEDEVGEAVAVDLPQVAGLDMAKFKEKARAFLRVNETHISLQRLRRNQPLTTQDINELEKMLVAAGGTPALISEAKAQAKGIGLFVRSLVGLDREAVVEAFSQFVAESQATPSQIEFVELVVQELTRNGVMEAERLFQSPFTDVNAQGPLAIFPQGRMAQLVDVLELIRGRAVA